MLRLHRQQRPPETTPFRVGPRSFAVRIAADPIILDGAVCMGLYDQGNREILLAHDLPPRLRFEVLLHELAHAFVFAFGFPRDIEDFCNFYASVSEQAWRDLAACGGEAALLALKPGELLTRTADAETAAA